MLVVEKPNIENRLAAAGMFVRARLDERLTLEAIAAVAGFSPHHFHRIFRVAFGENLNAYVVRHRLQRAAHELRYSDRSIIEIGLRCGYESPSAFGRAFGRALQRTPSAYRAAADDTALISDGSMSSLPEVPEPCIEVYFERESLALRHVGPYNALDTVFERLYEIASRRGFFPGTCVLGLSYDSPDLNEHEGLRFDACLTVTPNADVAGARADGLYSLLIAGGKHAVFRHRGPYQRITHAFDILIAAWVLTGRIELRDAPFIVTHLSDPVSVPAAHLECDLAIPIL